MLHINVFIFYTRLALKFTEHSWFDKGILMEFVSNMILIVWYVRCIYAVCKPYEGF